MAAIKVGDLVARKSHGEDVYFKVVKIVYKRGSEPVYILKGVMQRLVVDAELSDLVTLESERVDASRQRYFSDVRQHFYRSDYRASLQNHIRAGKPGRILHLDGDEDFMNICLEHYKNEGIECFGRAVEESKQPQTVTGLLRRYRPDIVVLTGHDAMKKDAAGEDTLSNYRTSVYFVRAAQMARRFEPNPDKLCIWSGACQSYFQEIMKAGSNFASSPGRILINALDPALVAEKVAVTDRSRMVTPQEAAIITKSGSQGVGGINTKGRKS
ncbi:MAG: sporulation peptidase YabG [Eubacteriales bacterium]|nr:sporulation peptidase YabG [Eubacteriales bacterium]